MRGPTPQERIKERPLSYAVCLDGVAVVLLVAFAIVTSSLTLIGEALRATLMLALSVYSLRVLKSVHRGELVDLEFGVAKLENLVAALVGAALLASGLWMAHKVFNAVLADHEVVTPFQLALAAVINAINTALNIVEWYSVRAAKGGHESEIFKAQLHNRFVMMVSSLTLQMTMTAAALARDPVLALGFDAIGACLVALVMLRNGYLLIKRALPTLLDARAPDHVRELILEKVTMVISPDQISSLRTRQLGNTTIAEVAVTATFAARAHELSALAASIEDELRRAGHHIDLLVVPEQSVTSERASAKEPVMPKAST